MAKDPMCPLGFHPQVRWPSRCKRCFRDYKEHAPKKEAESSSSSTTESTSALLNTRSLSLDTLSSATTVRSRFAPSYLSPTLSSTSSSYASDDTATTTSRTSSSSPTSTSSGVGTTSTSYSTSSEDSKDFSTPYSSISSEARNRLSRFRDESKSSKDSISEEPLLRRRRTTDLTDMEGEGSSADSSPSHSPSPTPADSVTIRLRKTNSLGSDPTESSPSPPLARFRLRTPEAQSSPSPPLSRFRTRTPEESPTSSPSPPLRNRTPTLLREKSPAPPSPSPSPTPPKPKVSFSPTLSTQKEAPSTSPTPKFSWQKKVADPKPAETKPPETKPSWNKPAEAKPPETKPTWGKPAETKPPETKTSSWSKPAETNKPTWGKPAAETTKPAETKPTWGKPSVPTSTSTPASDSSGRTTPTPAPAEPPLALPSDPPTKPKKTKKKRLLIQEVKEVTPTAQESTDSDSGEGEQSADVAFIIQVKSKGKKKFGEDDDDLMSMTTTTDTTETTLVDVMENTIGGMSSWEVEDMKKEVDRLREKCDKLEKEKAEILARRVASLDAPRPQSSEYLRLQQKVNQLTTANEDLKDEQKHLESRVRELESELSTRPNPDIFQRQISDLRSKLTAGETQLDQLQEEKREAIQQMKDMQEEFEEMQDSFREEQAEEFANLKKELDDASKNCRLLQFKLRKVEKRADQLEAEKKELEQRLESIQDSGRIRKLEEELKKARVEIEKIRTGTKENLLEVPGLRKKPLLTKSLSSEKDSSSMPPGFDPHKTLRDLQSALERESDTREQLRFAEEEATSLRQKISRIENENDTLLIQIKKMSSKSKPDLSNKGRAESGRLGEAPPKEQTEKLDVDDLKLQLELNEQESKVLQKKVEELEKTNAKLGRDLQKAEDKAQSLEKMSPSITKSKNLDEVTALRRKLIEKEREVERLETQIAAAPPGKGKPMRAKSVEQDATSKIDLETKAELSKVKAELAKLKAEAEGEKRTLREQLSETREDLESHQGRMHQMGEANKDLLSQMASMQKNLDQMKEQYENIQDDMVIKNSKLSGQKEQLESDMNRLRREHDTIDKELRALRDTFNSRQDTWIKDKLALQEKLQEAEQNAKKLMSIPGDRESTKLRNMLNESNKDLETKNSEMQGYKDQVLSMQRENDELRRQLEDFDKVAQVQLRSLTVEPSQKTDKELKELREKLTSGEKLHRNEMAQTKMRHDQDLAVKNEEISAVQQQLSRAKRERDTFRQMVDSAQRAIAELKSRGSANRGSVTGLEEAATGAQAAVSGLQERITALEDDLSEARRGTSRQKTEFVTEKSAWEMKMAELQQKINELEEEKLLSGAGRVRGASAIGRTKLELAWQKEREEQQRRLKEATTLARDLKTTLLEIEREKDRERMEAKRRFEQLKGSLEEDQTEMKRKVETSQNDLLELRDAHAKLRTANEKLRKDRERLESQREAQIKKELEMKKVRSEKDRMLDQIISKLAALNPTASNSNLSQLPPKLNAAEILHHLQNVKAIEDPEDLMNPKEKKRGHFKRAASVGDTDGSELPNSRESLVSMPASYGMKGYGYGAKQQQYTGSMSSSTLTLPSRGGVGSTGTSSRSKKISSNMSEGGGASMSNPFSPQGTLHRKALSLDQNVGMPDEKKIWKGGSEAGSGSSLTSMDDQFSRGSSMERVSRVAEKSKASTLVGKVKKFVKAKSIEETPAAEKLMMPGSGVSNAGSDLSLNSDIDGNGKKSMKDKMKGIFKRSTRSPSVERHLPGTPTASTLQLQSTSTAAPRPSREPTPKREPPAPPGPSQQRPLMASQQRPLMPSTYR